MRFLLLSIPWDCCHTSNCNFFLLSLICVLDISAALGLSLETMSKEELDESKDVMHLILQGVSCNSCLLTLVWCLIIGMATWPM